MGKIVLKELTYQCRTCEHMESWHNNMGENCVIECEMAPRVKRFSGWIDGAFYCDLWEEMQKDGE